MIVRIDSQPIVRPLPAPRRRLRVVWRNVGYYAVCLFLLGLASLVAARGRQDGLWLAALISLVLVVPLASPRPRSRTRKKV